MIEQLVNSKNHTIVLGEASTGKTENVLKPFIHKLLKLKQSGENIGITILEMNNEIQTMICETCELMGIRYAIASPKALQIDGVNLISVSKFLKNNKELMKDNQFSYQEMRELGTDFLKQIQSNLMDSKYAYSPIRHYLIVDEAANFLYPEIEFFLRSAKAYNITGIFVCQSLEQIGTELESTFLANCLNKIVSGLSPMNVVKMKDILGDKVKVIKSNEDIVVSIEDVIELPLPPFHCIARIQQEGVEEIPFVHECIFLHN